MRYYVFLTFEILSSIHLKIGESAIMLDKEQDLTKWKNPNIVEEEAILQFKEAYIEYVNDKLSAIFMYDFVPN